MNVRFPLFLALALTISSTVALAQPALERLEKQLQAPVAAQPARESGYLGLITRDEAGGGFIRVVQVVGDSPAALAGLRTDDLILSVDGRLTRSMNDLAAALQGRSAGDRLSLAVMRGQEERTIPVTLGRRTPADGPALIAPQDNNPLENPAVDRPAPAPDRVPPPASGTVRGDTARLDLLERRMAELERRLAELERLLSRRP